MPGPRPAPRARLLGLALLLAVLLPGTGCLLWRQPAGTAENPTVLDFDIEGTHAVRASDLRNELVTQPSGRKYFVVPVPEHLDEDAFANDQRRVVRFYQTRGYYHAEVKKAEVIPVDPGRVKIRMEVSEGPPVKVSRIDLPGIDAAPEAKARLDKLPLKVGDVFTEAAYDATRAAILKALTETGWAQAEVKSNAQIDPNLNEAHVTYEVDAGARYRFGEVFVAGAAQIPRARIRQEASAAATPGQTFSSSDLAKAQANVFDLGVFGGVRVSKGPPDETKKTIPTVVSVRESPFRTIRAGPGFTFQATSRWEVDGMVGWSHRNWLGGLRKLNLDARVGYAWLPTPLNAQKQGLVGLASADFTQPQFFTRYFDLNVHGELERGREFAYDYYAERLRLGLPLRFGRLFTFVPSVNFELYQLSTGVTSTTASGQQFTLSTCPGQNPDLCLLSYFEQRFGLDLRDDPINTTSGLYLGLSLQEGFSVKGNGAAYFRVLPEARVFVNPWRDIVLAGRLRVGIITAPPGTQLPVIALFASGGPNLMRGYYTRQLAPMLLACPAGTVPLPTTETPNPTCKDSDLQYLPVGGAGLIDGGVELRFPIAEKLGGALFLDFGNVTWAARDALDLRNLQYAVGAGVRYKTPLGPVRLDIAGRLPKPGEGMPGVQLLETSGRTLAPRADGAVHHLPIVSVHFTIGEAF